MKTNGRGSFLAQSSAHDERMWGASARVLRVDLRLRLLRRFNDTAQHIRGLGDDELIDFVRDAHLVLWVVDCFGLRDVWALCLGAAELERRGYQVRDVDDPRTASKTLEVFAPARSR